MIKTGLRNGHNKFKGLVVKSLLLCIGATMILAAAPQTVDAAPKTPKPANIAVTPLTPEITTDQSTRFIVEIISDSGESLGDVTNKSKLSIDEAALGYWAGNEYFAQNPGVWLVKAEYRGMSNVTELVVSGGTQTDNTTPTDETPIDETTPISPPSSWDPSSTPEPIEGEFFGQYNSVAEYEDMMAFVYSANGSSMIHIESNEGRFDYELPGIENFGLYNVKVVLSSKTELWVAYGLPIKINSYRITDNGLTLTDEASLGDTYSRLKGFIKLESGKLLVSWYQHQRTTDDLGNNGVNVGFAYYDGSWNQLPYTFVHPNTYPTNAALIQHPADNGIWWFSVHDGNHSVKVIHLIDTGSGVTVDWVDYEFITIDDPLAPEGEFPWITAAVDTSSNSILIAYQNNDRYWFSYDPFCKGAKINIVSVSSNGDRQLVEEVPYYTERIIPINLGVTNGTPWVAYGAISDGELDWNDLYIYSDGQNNLLGELEYGVPGNQFIRICNSSEWVIALMSDGFIHFFPTSQS